MNRVQLPQSYYPVYIGSKLNVQKTERTEDVKKTSWTSCKSLMYVQFTSYVYGVQGGSLPLAFKMFLRVPDTHLINLGRMKDSVKFLPSSDFEPRSHGLVIKCLNH